MSRKIGIIGFGSMGAEIALMAACAGHEVSVVVRSPATFDETRQRLAKLLKVLSRDEKFFAAARVADDALRQAVLDRIGSSTELEYVANCSVVIEAIPEKLELKTDLLGRLGALCAEDTMLATNTSSISITELAASTVGPTAWSGCTSSTRSRR